MFGTLIKANIALSKMNLFKSHERHLIFHIKCGKSPHFFSRARLFFCERLLVLCYKWVPSSVECCGKRRDLEILDVVAPG